MSFISFVLMIRSLIHFELIFTYGIWLRIQLYPFALRYPVFPATFVKETILSPLNNLDTLVEIQFTVGT